MYKYTNKNNSIGRTRKGIIVFYDKIGRNNGEKINKNSEAE